MERQEQIIKEQADTILKMSASTIRHAQKATTSNTKNSRRRLIDDHQPGTSTDKTVKVSADQLKQLEADSVKYQIFASGVRSLRGVVRSRLARKFSARDKLKKGKVLTRFCLDIGVDPRSLKPKDTTKVSPACSDREEKVNHIIDFLCRPEHSYTLPGKKDVVTVRKAGEPNKKVQKVVLTDLLSVLHDMYKSQYPERKVGLTTFKRVRKDAQFIKCVQCNNTRICLCTKHQNFTLRLRAAHLPGLPDAVVRTNTLDEFKERLGTSITHPTITVETWQMVDVEIQEKDPKTGKNKTCKKLRLRPDTHTKAEFITLMSADFKTMREHSFRAQNQHRVVREVREGMSATECTVQMDFSENWMVSFPESPQAVYYAKDPVTLHPAVIHYKDKDGNTKHHSLALCTNDRKHDAGAILAFMLKIREFIDEHLPNCTTIHYSSDSPSSQYRNRFIFSILCKHAQLFGGIQATWTYYEAGHGKGPCDGIGASAKRVADLLVKAGVVIENAQAFVDTGNAKEGAVTYIHVTLEEIKDSRSLLESLVCDKSVAGTMKVHAAVPAVPNVSIAVRDTSCFGPCCWEDNTSVRHCPGWVEHVLFKKNRRAAPPVATRAEAIPVATRAEAIPVATPVLPVEPAEEPEVERYTIDEYVACLHNTQWFVAKVTKAADAQGKYEVSLMERGNTPNQFQWPPRKDLIHLRASDILSRLAAAPKRIATRGKLASMYALPTAVLKEVTTLFLTS